MSSAKLAATGITMTPVKDALRKALKNWQTDICSK